MNEVKQLILTSWNWLYNPRTQVAGIRSFTEVKFYMILCLYLGSFLAFARDPFFLCQGVFVYQQGILTLLLAGTLVASFNWEWCLFGKPTGANLLLQVSQIFPLSLFIARISARPTVVPPPESWTGKAIELSKAGAKAVFGDILNNIPAWITDLFINWRIAVIMMLILFFLCFRSLQLKLAAVLSTLMVPFFTTVSKRPSPLFFIGMILLCFGMAMQLCRYDKILYYENVLRRLRKSRSLDSLFATVAMRLMVELETHNHLGENNLIGIVRTEYDPNGRLSPAEIRAIAGEILQRLVYENDLVVIQGDGDGLFMRADETLRCHDSLLTQLSIFPRVVLALVVATVWILLPIDLIPDSLPFIGMLDDVTIAIFSGIVLKNSTEGSHRHGQ